jgi:hypothetical protein
VEVNRVTVKSSNHEEMLEARVGIEPTYKGFADLVIAPLSSLLSQQINPRSFFWAKIGPTAATQAQPEGR